MSGNSGAWDARDARRQARQMRRETRREMRGADSLAHAVRGPITLVTVGVLFAFNNFTPYGFEKTWPVILIVFGLLTLVGRGTAPLPPEPPYQQAGTPYPAPPYTAPPYTAPPEAPSYRQSPYTQPPAGPAEGSTPAGTAKGGFGSSAPPKPPDSGQAPPSGGSV